MTSTSPPLVRYEQIWYGFKETCLHCVHFFKPLFSGWPTHHRPIRVVGPLPDTLPKDIHQRKYFWISFSGEPFQQPTTEGLYDAHLIMEPPDESRGIFWMPLFSMYAYALNCWVDLMTPRTLHRLKTKFCAMVVSNAGGEVRSRFFHRLNQVQRVDSYGKWENNVGYVLPMGQEHRCDALIPYKFVLCFENTIKSHYMTEKILNAYLCGAIPIYGGASISRDVLNPKAFLYLEDTSDAAMDTLIRQIMYLYQNEEAYRQMYEEPLLKDNCIPREMTIEYYKERLQALYDKK